MTSTAVCADFCLLGKKCSRALPKVFSKDLQVCQRIRAQNQCVLIRTVITPRAVTACIICMSLYSRLTYTENYSGGTSLVLQGQSPLAQLFHTKHWYIKHVEIHVYILIAVNLCPSNGLFNFSRRVVMLRRERSSPCEVIVSTENDSRV